jgi:hypothetical protein
MGSPMAAPSVMLSYRSGGAVVCFLTVTERQAGDAVVRQDQAGRNLG